MAHSFMPSSLQIGNTPNAVRTTPTRTVSNPESGTSAQPATSQTTELENGGQASSMRLSAPGLLGTPVPTEQALIETSVAATQSAAISLPQNSRHPQTVDHLQAPGAPGLEAPEEILELPQSPQRSVMVPSPIAMHVLSVIFEGVVNMLDNNSLSILLSAFPEYHDRALRPHRLATILRSDPEMFEAISMAPELIDIRRLSFTLGNDQILQRSFLENLARRIGYRRDEPFLFTILNTFWNMIDVAHSAKIGGALIGGYDEEAMRLMNGFDDSAMDLMSAIDGPLRAAAQEGRFDLIQNVGEAARNVVARTSTDQESHTAVLSTGFAGAVRCILCHHWDRIDQVFLLSKMGLVDYVNAVEAIRGALKDRLVETHTVDEERLNDLFPIYPNLNLDAQKMALVQFLMDSMRIDGTEPNSPFHLLP